MEHKLRPFAGRDRGPSIRFASSSMPPAPKQNHTWASSMAGGEAATRRNDVMAPEESVWITVRRQRDVVPLRIEMLLSHTVADLKEAIAKLGGVPGENQRIFHRSCLLGDRQTIEECGLAVRPEVQMVPHLGHKATPGVGSISARRGYNMVPGNVPWKPSRHAKLTSRDVHEFWGPGDPAGQLPRLPPAPATPRRTAGLSLPAVVVDLQ
uniref:Ubiquitin-like domain-containing protein n=2 Tax=Pyrodinium bahamense TaxID=73915 RepID=A0A7S0FCG1_9DINO|mmetsp:Transcript_20627/g.56918  ORF Transcript_20627/g.56918 Transcript_20627/m.56918 type:complete len:209 (+) Transcript_20627:64-690(+)